MEVNRRNNLKTYDSLIELLEDCPDNKTIRDNITRAWAKINSPKYEKIICSISGGSDSDFILDICFKCDKDKKVEYVWLDTGLEYQATKDHIKFLEEKYGIEIKSRRAKKPIPTCCKEYGQPFISKQVSEYMHRLQRHNFQWEDEDFDTLYKRYPKCKSALIWWCNKARCSAFNVNNNKWLKEFIVANPPTFKISNKCCEYAKKKVIHEVIEENHYDLEITGIRRSEGGARKQAYKNCFDSRDDSYDRYRPIFYYTDSDKIDYENALDVVHSRCYSEYGLPRTGCAGCCYGRGFETELEVIKKYEPKLYKAALNIFGDSYEYTRKYREFYSQKEMEIKK